ncbi:hypothetical protein Ddye_002033 [Dipteronia dyeriana]|uniref:Uncharacterized protein n=1 Tax=Dipteronia dyeriana TaxID=168575 RepID=A0AAE0CU34_9ROSI|nr:hypothetical protein Ddye_002033 [Dipteronia dyeriana]
MKLLPICSIRERCSKERCKILTRSFLMRREAFFELEQELKSAREERAKVVGASASAIGNLLEIEKYEVKRARYLELKMEKFEVDERLQIALGTIESLKAASVSYRRVNTICGEQHANLCDYRGCTNLSI